MKKKKTLRHKKRPYNDQLIFFILKWKYITLLSVLAGEHKILESVSFSYIS